MTTPAVTTSSKRVSGPLSIVANAMAGGVQTRADLSAQTGLDPEIVDAAVDHLIRMGRISSTALSGGCPDNGCGSCPSGTSKGTAGCGSAGPSTARGPVALTLVARRH